MSIPTAQVGSINLQATIAAATYMSNGPAVQPHFPLNCTEDLLALDEDGTLRCDHASCNDDRVRQSITHSVAIMIFEEAFRRYGGPVAESTK